jgi:pyruvate/2-oxoglutarate dehydrogenase complex dihydrolipoamide dehydrogenase (E3) component
MQIKVYKHNTHFPYSLTPSLIPSSLPEKKERTMSPPTHYDTISIGSGEAGKYLCWTRSATLGVRTAVIEHKQLGGSCPNTACLPSKNLIYAAGIAHAARKYRQTGLLVLGGRQQQQDGGNSSIDDDGDSNDRVQVGVNMERVRQRKRDMIHGLQEMHTAMFDKSGADLLLGHARLVGRNRVEVEMRDGSGIRELTADNIVLCTGSRANMSDNGIRGLQDVQPLSHVEALELGCVPRRFIVLGGGYVGLEFAQMFCRFGSEVVVVERGSSVLKSEDEDVSTALADILREEGVQFFTDTHVHAVTGMSGQSVTLSATHNGQAVEITGTHLLVASGRLPNTEDTGLREVGVELTSTGHVKVDEHLRTNISGIFAVGDCAGSPHFTHMGFDDFRIVRDFLLDKDSARSTKGRQVPYTLYTDPELAHVGLSEKTAKKAGVQYRLAKLPMAAFLRTRTMDATRGFAKTLVSATDDTILGFTALGPRAGELLPVVQLAMSSGLPYTSIADMIVTHPTMNEGLVSLFSNVQPRVA